MASTALPIRFNELLQVGALETQDGKLWLTSFTLQLTEKDIDVRLPISNVAAC